MDYKTYYERLQYILEITEKGRLLSLSQMAETFDCSERTVKRMIAMLREQGHPIYYDRNIGKFTIKEMV